MDKKEKVINYICDIFKKTGFYFMLFTMLLVILASFNESNQYFAISFFKFILLTSFLFALESYIFSIKKINVYILKVVIHYILTVLTFILVMCTWAKTTTSGKQTFILAIVYTLVYAIVIGVIAIIKFANKKKENKETEYKNQFIDKEQNEKMG